MGIQTFKRLQEGRYLEGKKEQRRVTPLNPVLTAKTTPRKEKKESSTQHGWRV